MNLKNLLSLFVVLQLIVMPVIAVQAAPKDNLTAEEQAELEANAAEAKTQAQETAAEVAEKMGLEYADLQVKMVAALDKSTDAIDQAIDTINASVYISSETKVELTDGLKTLQGKLLEYRTQVNNADTIEELQALNAEIVALLKANKTVIAEAMKESMLVIAEQVSQSMEKIKIKAEAALRTLDVECDSESFAEIDALVTQLETTNASLEAAIAANDVATAKVEAKAGISISVDLAASFAGLVADCQEEIEAQAEVNL